jgi:hypothetical protein
MVYAPGVVWLSAHHQSMLSSRKSERICTHETVPGVGHPTIPHELLLTMNFTRLQQDQQDPSSSQRYQSRPEQIRRHRYR